MPMPQPRAVFASAAHADLQTSSMGGGVQGRSRPLRRRRKRRHNNSVGSCIMDQLVGDKPASVECGVGGSPLAQRCS